MSELILRRMNESEWDEVTRLIHDSTNAWYMKNRGFSIFTAGWESVRLFCRTYEALDPGSTVVAFDPAEKKIVGSCFIHPRPTHYSLGIMNVHPDYFGRGISAKLLKYITDLADAEQKPVRLVSSTMNLDSFSLYNKAGFEPILFFQDMTMKVPVEGIAYSLPPGDSIRPATVDDIPAIVALERELYHIERGKDFRYFIENSDKIWRLSVYLSGGEIVGYLNSVNDPGSRMIGPGAMRTEEQAITLICEQLNTFRGEQPVWLIPSRLKKLATAMYTLGAKNCELHIAQVRGDRQPEKGVILPTFMPETS